MTKFSPFHAQDVYDGVTAITGIVRELAFLVRGSDRALLIDTLSGIGSLGTFCQGLTSLPIAVANTHGHVDHLGGNAEFGPCYIHPLDAEVARYQISIPKRTHFLVEECKVDLAARGASVDDFAGGELGPTLPLAEGDRLDLGGGRVLEVLHVPGHTAGSVAFLDIGARCAFIGDCLGTGLIHENSTTVEEYVAALERFKSHASRFDRMVWGHNNLERLTPADIDTVLEVCREILSGTDDAVPLRGHPIADDLVCAKRTDGQGRRLDGKWGNLVYDPKRVR